MAHTKRTTIGIDLGDKSHETCTLNHEGEITERSTLLNNKGSLIAFSKAHRHAVLIMEAGTHSPWISRLRRKSADTKSLLLTHANCEPSTKARTKTTSVMQRCTARIGRFDRKVLYGIEHKSELHQRALRVIHTRDALNDFQISSSSTTCADHSRAWVFSYPSCSTEAFARKATALPSPKKTMLWSHQPS